MDIKNNRQVEPLNENTSYLMALSKTFEKDAHFALAASLALGPTSIVVSEGYRLIFNNPENSIISLFVGLGITVGLGSYSFLNKLASIALGNAAIHKYNKDRHAK